MSVDLNLLKSPTRGAEDAAGRAALAASHAKAIAGRAAQVASHNSHEWQDNPAARQKLLGSPLRPTPRKWDTEPRSVSAGQDPLRPHPDRIPFHSSTFEFALERLAGGKKRIQFPPTQCEHEQVEELCKALKANARTFTHLSLARSVPLDTWAEQIMDTIRENQNIVHLDLSDNNLCNSNAEEPNLAPLEKIKAFCDLCESLETLDLSGNPFAAAGAEVVCQGVRESVRVKTLKLSGCDLANSSEDPSENPGLLSMNEMILKNKFIRRIILQDNQLKKDHVQVLSESLGKVHRVDTLDLNGNDLASPGASALGKLLRLNHGIQNLSVAGNGIGWKGIVGLCDALVGDNNTTVRSLNLSKNKFGISKGPQPQQPKGEGEEEEEEPEEDLDPEEAEEKRKEEQAKVDKLSENAAKASAKLAEMLITNKTLTELDLSANYMGSEHVALVFMALKDNTSLRTLHFEMNHIGGTCSHDEPEPIPPLPPRTEAGGTPDTNPVSAGPTPTEIEYEERVEERRRSEQGMESLCDCIAANKTLEHLSLSWNFLMGHGCKRMCQGLVDSMGSSNLTSLALAGNLIGDTGAVAVGHLLSQEGCGITYLDLSANGISPAGAEGLALGLGLAGSLGTLVLSNNPVASQGFAAISASILQHQGDGGVRSLWLQGCDIEGDAPRVKMLMDRLETLEMQDNPFSAAEVASCVQYLRTPSCKCRAFALWGRHGVDSETGGYLMQSLQKNSGVRIVDVGVTSGRNAGLIEQELSSRWE